MALQRIRVTRQRPPAPVYSTGSAVKSGSSVPPAELVIQRERSNAVANPGALSGAPGFPGGQLGAPIEIIRDLVQKQQRMKGFDFTIPVAAAGTIVNVPITNLAGAKIFLGLNFMSASQVGQVFSVQTVSLEINDEKIFTTIAILGLQTSNGNGMAMDYVSFPRPLSGQDKIDIEIILQQAVLVACPGQVQIWYI